MSEEESQMPDPIPSLLKLSQSLVLAPWSVDSVMLYPFLDNLKGPWYFAGSISASLQRGNLIRDPWDAMWFFSVVTPYIAGHLECEAPGVGIVKYHYYSPRQLSSLYDLAELKDRDRKEEVHLRDRLMEAIATQQQKDYENVQRACYDYWTYVDPHPTSAKDDPDSGEP
jgi:hypothetical protein